MNYDNMGLGEWDCNLLHIWEYMIVWIGTSQEPNRDRGCTSISSLKLKYKIFRDKQLSNLLNAGLGRLKRPSKGQGYCHPKLWWRDMVMVYCRIFDTGCFEHVSQNKRCAQESARRSNFLLPHRRIIMGHYIAHTTAPSRSRYLPSSPEDGWSHHFRSGRKERQVFHEDCKARRG